MKTQDRIGPALDQAVSFCLAGCRQTEWTTEQFKLGRTFVGAFSTDWALGGPIVEEYGITIQQSPDRDGWMAHNDGPASEGPTPLVAAMRCYVASLLGDEVQLPQEVSA